MMGHAAGWIRRWIDPFDVKNERIGL